MRAMSLSASPWPQARSQRPSQLGHIDGRWASAAVRSPSIAAIFSGPLWFHQKGVGTAQDEAKSADSANDALPAHRPTRAATQRVFMALDSCSCLSGSVLNRAANRRPPKCVRRLKSAAGGVRNCGGDGRHAALRNQRPAQAGEQLIRRMGQTYESSRFQPRKALPVCRQAAHRVDGYCLD